MEVKRKQYVAGIAAGGHYFEIWFSTRVEAIYATCRLVEDTRLPFTFYDAARMEKRVDQVLEPQQQGKTW